MIRMTPIESKKVVISGGPGSGKTTLINLLREKGYDCSNEFSIISMVLVVSHPLLSTTVTK